jgi:AMP deaminase
MLVDAELGQELKHIFESLEKCIFLREKYLSDSLQCLGDNPKDLDEWEIYRNFIIT